MNTHDVINWLAATRASSAFKDWDWFVPTVQTFHILSVSIVISSALMLSLRIWHFAGLSQTMSHTARRFLPWTWAALAVLAISGSLLIIAEPDRELDNPTFWLKMKLLLIGGVATGIFQATVHRSIAFWETSSTWRKVVRVAAVLVFLVWIGVIVCGRFIAYTLTS